MSPTTIIRRARSDEAEAAARVLIASRHAAVPAIPAPIHSDDEMLAWFRGHVMVNEEVWVASQGSAIVGVLVLTPGWIEHLYLDPDHTGAGVGSLLVDHAKAQANDRIMGQAVDRLDLWTFVSNTGARRFYERHGFVAIDRTDGDNEEGEPDILYRWQI